MSQLDQNKKKTSITDDDQDEGGSSGGQGGAIEFHDFLGTGNNWRDQLPQYEENRVLAVHSDANKENIKKGLEKAELYRDLKENKRSWAEYRQQLTQQNGVEAHPLFENNPRMAGVDNNVSPIPSDNNSEANDKDRKELTLQFQLQLQNRLQNQPELRQSPPRLTRG